jgi:hypothetical protein
MMTVMLLAAAVGAQPALTFQPSARPGYFSFDTGKIRGVLQADGRSHGIVHLVDVASGVDVARPGYPGIFSIYRLFSGSRRFPDGRTSPCVTALSEDGSRVRLKWRETGVYPFSLEAVYRLSDASSIDLEIRCVPKEALPSFEIFVSTYLTSDLQHFLFVKKTLHQGGGEAPQLISPEAAPFNDGCYLAFPRDVPSCLHFFDGRWQQPAHPVHWAIGHHYALPLAGSRNPGTGLTLLLFARREECFGMETTYRRSQGPDSVAGHNSIYLSLGGSDGKAGVPMRFTVTARLGQLSRPEDAIDLHKQWLQRWQKD